MPAIRAFCMPKWGIEMTQGTLAEWMVGEGEAFTRGQTLCLIETDKITNDVDAEFDAVLARIIVPAGGDPQPVGTLLGVFADPGTTNDEVDAFIAGFRPADTGVAAKRAEKPAAPAPQAAATRDDDAPPPIVTNRPISAEALKLAERERVDLAAIEGSGRGGRITFQDVQQASRPAASLRPRGPQSVIEEVAAIFASPLARRLAALHGVDLGGVQGTGPRGRISKADVLALATPTVPLSARDAAFTLVENRAVVEPFDKIRKVVARRLTDAARDIPHFYLRTSAATDGLMALRKTANLVLGCKASLNDLIVMATAKALVRHPDINVQVRGEELHRFAHADIAIAVASPKGLVTPIVRQADRMRLDQLAAATRELIDKANAGRLSYDDLDGGTFSISNLGMFGIESFDAIINPPQAAILAVGAIMPVTQQDGTGAYRTENRIALTMSVDHRAIDGAAGASFLATLKALIEAPETLFA